ncbi:EAL domain-containing protein [Vibrio sp.]|uniref:EAL domain-containing protein n=1 Tax=Vibrio sp. TaxID=678 RepID=UPI003D0BA39D
MLALNKAALTISDIDELMNNHFIHMFDVMNDGVFYMSGEDTVFFYNSAFYEKFGLSNGQFDMQVWMELVHPVDQLKLLNRIDAHLLDVDSKVTSQYRVKQSNGEYMWVEATAITHTKDGQRFMIGCHRDISDKKLMESFVQQAAFRDSSSGLSNRSKLLIDMDELAQDPQHSHSLFYIQIDDIKSYLNLYGSEVIKELLKHLQCALSCLPNRYADFYRVRSDDFAVIVSGQYQGGELVKLGETLVRNYQQSLNDQGNLYGKNISIGIYPNLNTGLSPADIIHVASRTCQFASEKSANHVEVYEACTKAKVDRHFYIEHGLQSAIYEETLKVKFQPIICAQSQSIASFEALVRWSSSSFGEIYPDEFISVAENKGLIVDLGYLVFDKACEFIRRYQQTHGKDVRVNINVSVLQLLNRQFPKRLQAIVCKHGVATKHIVLELTETIILDGNEEAVEQLDKLSQLGFKLSLDDFGAGYSSLNSFFDLPLDQIKIDKSMAWRALDNPASNEYLRFVIQLCRTHNVDIVIEGIETADIQHKFIEMGATYLQGYWFSKPLTIASATRYTCV